MIMTGRLCVCRGTDLPSGGFLLIQYLTPYPPDRSVNNKANKNYKIRLFASTDMQLVLVLVKF